MNNIVTINSTHTHHNIHTTQLDRHEYIHTDGYTKNLPVCAQAIRSLLAMMMGTEYF